jgi:hypothetical protein
LSLNSTNEKFYKIDQYFRCTNIDYLDSAVTNIFIDSENKIS